MGKRVHQGALWSLLNNVVLRLGSLVSGIALARLLTPTDYGVYAVALVALTLMYAVNELGVSFALVRWEGDVRTFAPTVFTIALATSLVFFAVAFVLAPGFCDLMGSPDATPVLRLMCFSVIIDGISITPTGILNREFMQRRRFVGDVVSFTSSTAVTITLAAMGAGAISFSWGRIVGGVLATTAFWLLSPVKVWPGWDRAHARELVRFGLPLAGSSLLVLAVSNVDKLLVGNILAEAALGLYLMAYNQSSWPLTVFSEAARRVSLAGFSRLADQTEELARSLARGFALLMAVTVPTCALLAAYAEPMLVVVYGAQWAPAAEALQWLALLGLLRVALFVCWDLLVALGKGRQLIGLQLLWLVVMVPATIVGAHLDGIRGASAGQALVVLVIVAPAFALTLRGLGMRPAQLFAASVRPALAGALILLTAVGVWALVDGALARLLVGGFVGVGVSAALLYPMRRMLPGRGGTQPRHRRGGSAEAETRTDVQPDLAGTSRPPMEAS